MATKTVRKQALTETSALVMERSGLGQVAEYDVYLVEGETKTYLGGGTKSEAAKTFRKNL